MLKTNINYVQKKVRNNGLHFYSTQSNNKLQTKYNIEQKLISIISYLLTELEILALKSATFTNDINTSETEH